MNTRGSMKKVDFKKDFVVFILTHGRVDNQYTYRSLCEQGYTGRCVFVLDNEDGQVEEYKRRYGADNCYVFDKLAMSKRIDEVFRGDRRVIVYARNACFDAARALGYKYFIELDDDYTSFVWRFDAECAYTPKTPKIKNLDVVFESMLRYYINTPLTSLAMAQGGDFIGGSSNQMLRSIGTKRKAMNSFICSVDRPFEFKGRINEDVNAYTQLTSVGKIFLTIVQCNLQQKITQSNGGGMTDVYRDSGTYVKSFSSVIVFPSGVKVTLLNSHHKRIHHNVYWEHTAPKILQEKWRKK
nr:MAG TPA: RfbF-like protein [Caudoviricetes sp.]